VHLTDGASSALLEHSLQSGMRSSSASASPSTNGDIDCSHRVEVEDFHFSYGVYANGARVICFAEGLIGYREWACRNGRLADIHSLDDRLDHDVDELMA
jgi:hypothetical protein